VVIASPFFYHPASSWPRPRPAGRSILCGILHLMRCALVTYPVASGHHHRFHSDGGPVRERELSLVMWVLLGD
jgi:hypothetical protein